MTERPLTFFDWNTNHVKIKFEIDTFEAMVFSFGNNIFSTIEPDEVKDLLINRSKVLLKLYRDNFDNIQTQHKSLLENGVQSN